MRDVDGEVDRVLGLDVLAAKPVIVEPWLSVGVEIESEVVSAGTASPNTTVVPVASDSETDV